MSLDSEICADCYTKRDAEECESVSTDNVWFNCTCYNATHVADYDDSTNWLREQISRRTSATEEYFKSVFENLIRYDNRKF